jgi:hypothetical protein
VFFKRDMDTRKRKTEKMPKKILTVDISPVTFPPIMPIPPTCFSIVLICQQQTANGTNQIVKVRDHIFLHPTQTTRNVPFNIPLAKGKIRNREFIFVGVDHESNSVYELEWKLAGDTSYYRGFFKVLSRNTKGEGIKKQVEQGLPPLTEELWSKIVAAARERTEVVPFESCNCDKSIEEPPAKRSKLSSPSVSPTVNPIQLSSSPVITPEDTNLSSMEPVYYATPAPASPLPSATNLIPQQPMLPVYSNTNVIPQCTQDQFQTSLSFYNPINLDFMVESNMLSLLQSASIPTSQSSAIDPDVSPKCDLDSFDSDPLDIHSLIEDSEPSFWELSTDAFACGLLGDCEKEDTANDPFHNYFATTSSAVHAEIDSFDQQQGIFVSSSRPSMDSVVDHLKLFFAAQEC